MVSCGLQMRRHSCFVRPPRFETVQTLITLSFAAYIEAYARAAGVVTENRAVIFLSIVECHFCTIQITSL